jgi:hypothetical protein
MREIRGRRRGCGIGGGRAVSGGEEAGPWTAASRAREQWWVAVDCGWESWAARYRFHSKGKLARGSIGKKTDRKPDDG